MLNHMGPEKQLSTAPDRLLHKLCAAVESKLQPCRGVDLPVLCDEIGLPHAPDDEKLTKRSTSGVAWRSSRKVTRHAMSPPSSPPGIQSANTLTTRRTKSKNCFGRHGSPTSRRGYAASWRRHSIEWNSSRFPTRFLMCWPNYLSSIQVAFCCGTSATHSTGKSVSM